MLAPLLTLVLASLRGQLNLTSDVLAFLVAVIASPWSAGFVPAMLEAIAGSLLLNYYFTPPIHQFTIAEANNALALGVFVAVGLLVSTVVDMPPGAPGRRPGPAPSRNCWSPRRAACCAASRPWPRCWTGSVSRSACSR